MLNNAGLLPKHNKTLIANIVYDNEIGLLPKEVDIDASFI
jgi:hypothetical protein